ncbi:MAG: hypothetical protein EXR75_13285, partial [Myxococcales bacterium]|nr:hypothetical protein [Myxococcales bacterium]
MLWATITATIAEMLESGPRHRDPSRCSRVLDRAAPSAETLALAMLVGAIPTALVNAAAIALFVPAPRAGWSLRMAHHAYDAVGVFGVAGLVAAMPALADVLVRRWPWLGARRLRQTAWLGFAIATTLAMHGLVGVDLERQGNAVLDGRLSWLLAPVYGGLVGLAVPAACVIGAGLAALGGAFVWLGIAASLGLIAGHHFVLRDDYPGVHAAIAWAGAVLFGSTLAWRVRGCLGRGRARTVSVLAGAAVLAAIHVAPPNAVRLELFRESGAVAAWVLAKHVWRPPRLDRIDGDTSSAALHCGSRAATASASIPQSASPPALAARLTPSLHRVALPTAPVVVLVTVDAMRADVLFPREHDARFPNLVRLRDGGAYFPRAIAHGSQTS